MTAKIKPGDFVITRSGWRRLEGNLAISATEKSITYLPSWSGSQPRRMMIQGLIFTGPEEIGRKLLAQLESSADLANQEQMAAGQRREKRDEKLIAEAYAKAEGRS